MTVQSPSVIAMPQPSSVQDVQPPGPLHTTETLHRRKKTLFDLGIAEAILGALSIILAIISVSIVSEEADRYYTNSYLNYYDYYPLSITYASQGIWGGCFVLCTGVLGIRVLSNPSKGLYIANIISAVITANIACAVVIISITAAFSCFFSRSLILLHCAIALLNFIAFILAVMHTGFSCSATCCRSRSVVTQQVTYFQHPTLFSEQHTQYTPGPHSEVFTISNQTKQGTTNITQTATFPNQLNIKSPINN